MSLEEEQGSAEHGWPMSADIRDGVTVDEEIVRSRYLHTAMRPATQPGFYVLTLEARREASSGSEEPAARKFSYFIAQASENLDELTGVEASALLGMNIGDLLTSEVEAEHLLGCFEEAKLRGAENAAHRDPVRWMETSLPFIMPDAPMQERMARDISTDMSDMEETEEKLNHVYSRWIHTFVDVKCVPDKTVAVACTISLTNDEDFIHLTMEKKEVMIGPFLESTEVVQERERSVQIMPPLPKDASGGSSVQGLFADTMDALYRITHAERIMVYRFCEEDFHGEVVAERLVPGTGLPMQGLHFPASDIPLFARMLFMRVPLRLIPDVAGHRLIPLVPRDIEKLSVHEGGQSRLFAPDMAECPARAVSGCHTTYLSNMSVLSSCILPIIVRVKLWGLISLQHLTKTVRLSLWSRGQSVMVAMALARQLHSHIERDMFASSIRIEQLAMTSMMSSSCLSEFFAHSYQGVLRELDCCGMMVKATVSSQGSGETLHYGQLAPSTMDGIAKVVGSSATVEDSPEGICCLSCVGPFAQDQGAATSLNDPSGLLVAGASFISTNYFQLVLFRPEWEHSVDWAGKAHIEVDPGKGRETDPHERLNPRTSFQLWKENRQGLSKPWSQGDRSLLRALRLKVHFFCSHMLHVQARMSMRS